LLAGLQEAAARCEMQYDAMLAEMRQAAVELGLAVAGRLVLDSAEAGDFPVEVVVRHVVARLPRRTTIEVHLHPRDLESLRDRLGEDGSIGGPTVRFHADPAAARGACRAVAGGVTVLSDLSLQLADLRHHLLEGLP
jgi:flagellar biosynthesis/type III secretory pathway protein FliH